jgi:myo-inositol-1(or 4)-monophosphatase
MNKNFAPVIDFIIELGECIRYSQTQIILSDQKDIKLKTDKELHEKIVSFLLKSYPYKILSEEDEYNASYTKYENPFWIIDPLDGSLNFSRDIPISCISIALWNKDSVEFGCIYDFNRKEIFVSNNNIFLINDIPGKTSITKSTDKGILCSGFPSWRNYDDDSLKLFLKKIQNWKKIRAIGSAALSLTWVARGWVDAYIEEDIRIWDVAAGLAMVKASGGKVYLNENKRSNFVTAIATNGIISIENLLL